MQPESSSERSYRVRAAVRRLNRIRWNAKAKSLRAYGGNGASASERAKYVLWDPEVGDFSFHMADLDAAAAFLADGFGVSAARARELLDEPASDEQLRRDYGQLRRWSQLRPDMALGHRPLLWALIRLRRPTLVVETGLWYGLGAMVMLRALERNAEEGHGCGKLISFDPDPTAGWMVPQRHAPHWTWVQATTQSALEANLRGRQLDLFVHDTPSEPQLERYELRTAWAASSSGAVICSSNGKNTPALEELCSARDLRHLHHDYTAAGHFYRGNGVSFAIARSVS
ncbi:hypothetical protein GKE82_04950 [Conexibacter sp. W3-3-2]|uniref:class I SAM-dependent methyltransferase n=1 Tax=Conexibacter sp. W3-3-2 TaxID=2675227 RepID=UPI0012B72CB9|nr:class I SAM-dependent methyltransferase [Conexibacter sp. W3-3-2]MTD43669.1 hypothetical protein [Conexibacter sp. W3-3-2]